MNSLKRIDFKIFAILMITAIIFPSCGGKDKYPELKPSALSDVISSGNIKDLRLTIHYLSSSTFTYSLNVDELIKMTGVDKIVIFVDGEHLEEQIDLLIQLCNADLAPVEQDTYLHTHLCYIFETEKDGRIFEVATGGIIYGDEGKFIDTCSYVNGVAVENRDIFYAVIMPFLIGDANEEVKGYVEHIWSD